LTFAEIAASHEQLEAENRELRSALLSRDERLDQIEPQLAWFKRQMFGETSERRAVVDPSVQSSLFASLGITVPTPPVEPESPPAKKPRRKKSRQDTVTAPQCQARAPALWCRCSG